MYLQLDTRFNPFTYDEMVKPLQYYKEAYDAAEAAYSELSFNTEQWKDMIDRDNSPEAFEKYQRYSGDLAGAVDDFSRGMNRSNRRALLGLKRRYAQEITPIERAKEAMDKANELRLSAGPDAIFEVGEYNSLDSFLHGKTANNNYTSRDALTKKVAAMTEAAMAEALRDPDFKKYMGDQFWLITQHTGGSYEDLMQAIANNPNAQSRLAEIKRKVMEDAGIERYDLRGQSAIEDAINTGLYAGLDKPVKSFQANADHITPVQSHSMRMAEQELALKQYQMNMAAIASGMVKNSDGTWSYDPDKDADIIKATRVQELKNEAKNSSGNSKSNKETIDRADYSGKKLISVNVKSGKTTPISTGMIPTGAKLTSYKDLSAEHKKYADIIRGNDSETAYQWFVKGDELVPYTAKAINVNKNDDNSETKEGL